MRRFFSKFFANKKSKKPQLQLQAMAIERKVEYTTGIGRVSITWSREVTGISLFIQIDLSNCVADDDQRGSFYDFRLSPSFPAQRCGLRLFNMYVRGTDVARRLKFGRDFKNAQYNASKDVQPVSNYYFCIAAEEEMILMLGDMKEEAHNHVKAQWGSVVVIPTAREETVNLRGCIYSTNVVLGGQEREIAVNFNRRMEDSMTMWIDRRKMVEVETKWRKFEGSREVNVPGGVIKIIWDRGEWTNRENKTCCSAAGEFAIARLALSYARVEGGRRNVENYIHFNLFC